MTKLSTELKKSGHKIEPSNKRFKCDDCKYIFESEKKKRKCPKCKSINININVKKVIKKKVIKNNQTTTKGNTKGTMCRRESVKVKIKPYDSGQFKKETKTFTKKVEFQVSERRQPYEDVEIVCSACGGTFEVHPIHVHESWKCDACIHP